MSTQVTAESAGMEQTPLAARGEALRKWRKRNRISQAQLAEQAKVSTDTVQRAEKGGVPDETMDLLEEVRLDYDATMGAPTSSATDVIEFKISGNFGVDLIVKGPVSDMEEMERSVMRIMGRMGGAGTTQED